MTPKKKLGKHSKIKLKNNLTYKYNLIEKLLKSLLDNSTPNRIIIQTSKI
jgi:hypothetical protein